MHNEYWLICTQMWSRLPFIFVFDIFHLRRQNKRKSNFFLLPIHGSLFVFSCFFFVVFSFLLILFCFIQTSERQKRAPIASFQFYRKIRTSILKQRINIFLSSLPWNNWFPIFDFNFVFHFSESIQRNSFFFLCSSVCSSVHLASKYIIVDWKSTEFWNKMAERSALWLDTMSWAVTFHTYRIYFYIHTRHMWCARGAQSSSLSMFSHLYAYMRAKESLLHMFPFIFFGLRCTDKWS